MRRRTFFILISALSWMGCGGWLLAKGLKYMMLSPYLYSHATIQSAFPFIKLTFKGLAWILGSGLLGFFKGRMILAKTARKIMGRIYDSPPPLKWRTVYTPSYLLLITAVGMMGAAMNRLGLPDQWRGAIDTALGVALLTGSWIYWRFAKEKREIAITGQ